MGGVAGHMAHLSEDLDLTFNEIVKILGQVANGEIKNATEKVDGQNLFLTVDSTGEIRTARNNTDIKNGGMSTEEYISKWLGHPAESAFTNGFKAVSMALRDLDPESLQDLFSGGERYINMEIMYPKNPNIIQYSAPQIVFHALKYFGSHESGEEQKLANDAFQRLSTLLDGTTKEVGEEMWTINGPKIVELQKLADGTVLQKVTSEIEKFAAPVGMDAKLGDLVKLHLQKFAFENGIPEDRIKDLVFLSLDHDSAKEKGITVNILKKGLPKEQQKIVSTMATKTNARKLHSVILQPIEKAISDFAIEVLRGISSYFVDDNDKETARMRAELERSIKHLEALRNSGDEKMGELIDKQLAKLGKIENVASSMEGVVFEYPPGSGKIYKLTGAFAMANQIIGRARRSGMNEGYSQDFTITISKDKIITKPLNTWLQEIKRSNHTFEKLPTMVYKDVLAGIPLIDIVTKENAEKTIYNTILSYVNGLQEDEEIELDFIDDEDADPVDDIIAEEPMTYAIVPGAFKPPHAGHADMVRRYATGDGVPKADEVRVVISAPMNAQRMLRDGTAINEKHAIEFWKNLFPEVANLPNVEFEVAPSEMRSPITVAFEYIGERSPLPLKDGDKVILGASDKADKRGNPDWMRWSSVEDKHVKGGIELLAGQEYAVPAYSAGADVAFSATRMRDLISDLVENPSDKDAFNELAAFVPEDKIPELFKTLDKPVPSIGIDELSAMAGGAVQGAAVGAKGGPWPEFDEKENEEEVQRSRLTTTENIDLNTVDEVIRLIMEKGIRI